jgi:hypothetical protein
MWTDNMVLEIIDILVIVIKNINGRVWLEQGMTSTDCRSGPQPQRYTSTLKEKRNSTHS